MNMINYMTWLKTPLITRVKIAQQFGIAKLRSTHVSNDVVVDDGYNIADVERAMSVEAMQLFTESKEKNVLVLFQMVVDKLEGKVVEKEVESINEDVLPVEEPIKKSKGRPKKIK